MVAEIIDDIPINRTLPQPVRNLVYTALNILSNVKVTIIIVKEYDIWTLPFTRKLKIGFDKGIIKITPSAQII